MDKRSRTKSCRVVREQNPMLRKSHEVSQRMVRRRQQLNKIIISQPKGWLFLLFVRSSSSLRHSREPLRHFRGSCLSVWLRLDSSPLWPQPDYRQVWQRASLALLLLTPSEIFTCLRLREYFFSCLGSRHDPIANARGLGFAPATEGGHESHS